KVLKIQREIMELKYFREFDFVNWINFTSKDADFTPGYYFQPWVPIGDKLWKIDVWLITKEFDKTSKVIEYFNSMIDNEKKRIILEIKQAMYNGKKYDSGVNGELIYQAVLEEGIRTVEN